MHASTISDDLIALAGIFQAVALVRQAARQGDVDGPAFQTCIKSVLRLDSENASEVFGGISNLKPGFRLLRNHLDRRAGKPDAEITGYVVALMFLERKLIGSPPMLDSLRRGICALEFRQESAVQSDVISALAQLYSDTVSRLNPRILVHGVPEYLNDASTADRIRALLLAGIRATVLWRQVGGSRLRLLFGRKRAAAAADDVLRGMETTPP